MHDVKDVLDVYKQIKDMSLAGRLRLAADLLDSGKIDMADLASSIVAMTAHELNTALLDNPSVRS